MHITPILLLRVLMRTYLVNSAYNMRGLQNVGFIYAMEPGLRAIHADPAELRKARGRYVRHHNCHPFWTPFLAGIFLRTESDIAAGRMAPTTYTAIKDTATNTLSALGDSVFGGTLLVTWALACTALILGSHPDVAVACSVLLFLTLQVFKACTFAVGLRFGFSSLIWLRRWDLINWGDRFKEVNALVLLFVLAQCIPHDTTPVLWGAAVSCAILGAWLTAQLHVPRTLLALLATTGLLLSI